MATNCGDQQLKITSKISTKHSFQMLDSMRRDRKLCDVILIAGKTEIPAHKNVLASCSPYFYSIFVNCTRKVQERLEMDVNPEMLLLMIDYLYTSQLTISERTLKDTLEIAKLLLLNGVEKECYNFLKHNINISNSFYVKTLAITYGDSKLRTEISSFIDANFADIATSDEFLNLTNDEVKELLCKDSLKVPCEEKVYECVTRWIKHDLKERRKYIRSLMECVRLRFISKKYLSEHILNDPLLADDMYCKDLIIKALLENELGNSLELKHRKYAKVRQVMLVIGGWSSESENTLEFYDFEKSSWSEVLKIPFKVRRAKLEVLDQKVYLIGGIRNDKTVRTVSCYNLTLNNWYNIPDMMEKRRGHSAANLNNSIYVFGGYDGTKYLNSGERFCRENEKWISIAPMSRNKGWFGSCVVNDIIYVVGGCSGDNVLNCVESYDHRQNKWTQLCSMKECRGGLGLCAIDGMVYAIGGQNSNKESLRTAEKYNPEIDSWMEIAPMNQSRTSIDVAIKDNHIYVVGGYHLESSTKMNSVEVYNIRTNTWTTLPQSMNVARNLHCVAMVDLVET